jgi:hypothetical protein
MCCVRSGEATITRHIYTTVFESRLHIAPEAFKQYHVNSYPGRYFQRNDSQKAYVHSSRGAKTGLTNISVEGIKTDIRRKGNTED